MRNRIAFVESYAKYITLLAAISFCGVSGALAEKSLNKSIEKSFREAVCVHSTEKSLNLADIEEYYSQRNYAPIWNTAGNTNAQAKVLLAELNRSTAHGLKPGFYEYSSLVDLADDDTNTSRACFDVLLSKALVLYANDIANGHIRKSSAPENTLVEPIDYSANIVLEKASGNDELSTFLKSLLTTDDRYIRLITKLAEFLRIDKLNAWPVIENLGSSENIQVDMEKVRDLLLYTGDLSGKDLLKAKKGSVELSDAIGAFQKRHGLPVSRKVDHLTFDEMASPLSSRIDMIRVNLERRRWQNRDLGDDYAYVNINDNSVRFVRNSKKAGTGKLSQVAGLENLPAFYGEIVSVGPAKNGELVLEVVSEGDELNVEFALKGDASENLAYIFEDVAKVRKEFANGQRIKLSNPLNLYATYLTVWANKDGSIHFRPDRFSRDDKIARLLGISSP